MFVKSNCIIVQVKSYIVLWYPQPFLRSLAAVRV